MFWETLSYGLITSLSSVFKIAIILLPFMVAIEIAKHYNVLDILSKKMEPLAKVLHLPREAAFPLMAGLVLGITYGAAIIIDYAREGRLTRRELMLIAIYLSINHSIFEDTIIFVALGANVFTLVIIRFILAFLITRIAGHLIQEEPSLKKQTSLSR